MIDVQNRKSQRVGGGGEDKRDVQHRLATSIIQKEIDETSEREIELVKHGKIQTTSIQRVDSKVTNYYFLHVSSNRALLQ